jgi:hypothetical protein
MYLLFTAFARAAAVRQYFLWQVLFSRTGARLMAGLPDGAHGEAGRGRWRSPDEEPLTVLLDLGLGPGMEIGDDLRP